MIAVLFDGIDFTPENLSMLVGWYVVFVISLTFHEAAHAFAGWKLGDSTAYDGGQVTLNPLPHIEREPIGTIAMPILTFFMMGWMMGWASAPYDPYWAIRHPRRAVLMAMAGPAANLFLALIAATAMTIGVANNFFVMSDLNDPTIELWQIVGGVKEGLALGAAKLLGMMFFLNLLLFAFNLIPVPPLDGSTLWSLVLKHETYLRFQIAMRQPIYMMLGMIVAWTLLPGIFLPIFYWSRAMIHQLAQ